MAGKDHPMFVVESVQTKMGTPLVGRPQEPFRAAVIEFADGYRMHLSQYKHEAPEWGIDAVLTCDGYPLIRHPEGDRTVRVMSAQDDVRDQLNKVDAVMRELAAEVAKNQDEHAATLAQDSELIQGSLTPEERRIMNVVQGYRISYLPERLTGVYVIEALDNAGNYIKDVSSWSTYEQAYSKLAVFLMMTDGKGVSEEEPTYADIRREKDEANAEEYRRDMLDDRDDEDDERED